MRGHGGPDDADGVASYARDEVRAREAILCADAPAFSCHFDERGVHGFINKKSFSPSGSFSSGEFQRGCFSRSQKISEGARRCGDVANRCVEATENSFEIVYQSVLVSLCRALGRAQDEIELMPSTMALTVAIGLGSSFARSVVDGMRCECSGCHISSFSEAYLDVPAGASSVPQG